MRTFKGLENGMVVADLPVRMEAGRRVDAQTALITSGREYFDRDEDALEDADVFGSRSKGIYFARSPKSDIWVPFDELPPETEQALRERVLAKIDRWREVRREAGRDIDPVTAEFMWSYEYTLDPYGIHGDLSEEEQQVGREYFARSPESEIWVWSGDLPKATMEKLLLRERMTSEGEIESEGERITRILGLNNCENEAA